MHNRKGIFGDCLTAEQARAMIVFQGVSVREWALSRRFDPATVHRVLKGEIAGDFGTGHEIKVALGMKAGVSTVTGGVSDAAGTAHRG